MNHLTFVSGTHKANRIINNQELLLARSHTNTIVFEKKFWRTGFLECSLTTHLKKIIEDIT